MPCLADPPPLKIHRRLSAQGSQIHSNNRASSRRAPTHNSRRRQELFLACVHTLILMLPVLAFKRCTAGDGTDAQSMQEERRSNLCRPGSTHSALTPTHHTPPPVTIKSIILQTQFIVSVRLSCPLCLCNTEFRRPAAQHMSVLLKNEKCPNSCWDTSHFRLPIVHTMLGSVLLYHSISRSCCIWTSVVTA